MGRRTLEVTRKREVTKPELTWTRVVVNVVIVTRNRLCCCVSRTPVMICDDYYVVRESVVQ